MNAFNGSGSIFSVLKQYRVHILVFFFVFFVGLTFAHPELLMNDEWITVNQLHQLHEGHQIITNEGKYGYYENGTIAGYFAARHNILGYPLFLPLVSLPSHWLIDFFGDNFVFVILYLWTIIAIALILSLHLFFREYTYIRKWRWTPAAIGGVFILFFMNLFYYTPFSVNSYPEAMAVVFTNIILLAIAGTLIYEINRALFEDPVFSVFGTIVCLSSSSYIFWATGCKDHILTMLLFVAILFCMVKFRKTDDSWYFPLAFIIIGLLAWTRPELALWVFIVVCGIWGYTCLRNPQKKCGSKDIVLKYSPLCTIFGALPFFLNNLLMTRNVFLPPFTLNGEFIGFAEHLSSQGQQNGTISINPLLQIITMNNTIPTSIHFEDLFGILFYPLTGSIGIFSITPLFLVMAVLAVMLVVSGKVKFTQEEHHTIAVIILLALSVFLAYAGRLHGMNVDIGITPDIRYLSSLYVPLTLLGLIIMKKIQRDQVNPIKILQIMLAISILIIPLSLFVMSTAYADPKIALELDAPLSAAFSFCIFFISVITLIILLWNFFSKRRNGISSVLIASICTIPFIWQIDISIRFWAFGATGQGYPPWIPIIRILNFLLASPLFAH